MRPGARHALLFLLIAGLVSFISCSKGIEMQFKEFVDAHVAKLQPLEKESNLAYWRAAISGKEEDYTKYSEAQLKLEKLYTNAEEFAFVKRAKESLKLKDPQLQRTADILYLRYLGNQTDSLLLKQMIDIAAAVENRFTVYRPVIGGKEMTTNDVYRILGEEKSSLKRRETWEASKGVGPIVLDSLLQLVKLRNESAKKVGFDNFYTMSLTLAEQNEDELVKLFAELDELTREPFLMMKNELDADLANSYKIKVADLRPWHYHDPYFQELPQVGEIDLDKYYKGKDPVEIAKVFFAGIGMNADDILARSDLYEKTGKNPHAFCTDIDRGGDIRILANMKDNGYWMETILHELGHGVYDKNLDHESPVPSENLPAPLRDGGLGRVLRAPLARSRVDEGGARPRRQGSREGRSRPHGIASHEAAHLRALVPGDVPLRALALQGSRPGSQHALVGSRRAVSVREAPRGAERSRLGDEDSHRHEPGVLSQLPARRAHRLPAPAPYRRAGARRLGGEIYGNPAVGAYLKDSLYAKGDVMPWNKLIEAATGEPLTARYFAEQFVKGAR